MTITSIECEATTCIYHNGGRGCDADFITVDACGQCLGYEYHYKKFPNLWARGYYCGSAGHVSQDSVKRYILEQEGKKVFDYDIYNCPEHLKGQLTLGDFNA